MDSSHRGHKQFALKRRVCAVRSVGINDCKPKRLVLAGSTFLFNYYFMFCAKQSCERASHSEKCFSPILRHSKFSNFQLKPLIPNIERSNILCFGIKEVNILRMLHMDNSHRGHEKFTLRSALAAS